MYSIWNKPRGQLFLNSYNSLLVRLKKIGFILYFFLLWDAHPNIFARLKKNWFLGFLCIKSPPTSTAYIKKIPPIWPNIINRYCVNEFLSLEKKQWNDAIQSIWDQQNSNRIKVYFNPGQTKKCVDRIFINVIYRVFLLW